MNSLARGGESERSKMKTPLERVSLWWEDGLFTDERGERSIQEGYRLEKGGHLPNWQVRLQLAPGNRRNINPTKKLNLRNSRGGVFIQNAFNLSAMKEVKLTTHPENVETFDYTT